MNINSVINYCLGLSFFDLQNYAGQNFNKVYDYVKKASGVNPNKVLVPSIFVCIASDGRMTEEEWKFIAQFIGGYSYEEALETAGEFYCLEAQETVRKLYQAFPADVKDAYLAMCIAVLAVDKRLNDAEVTCLEKLLG